MPPANSTYFVVRHHSTLAYVRYARIAPKGRPAERLVKDVQKAWRFLSPQEARKEAETMPVPLTWDVVPVTFDHASGQVIRVGPPITAA